MRETVFESILELAKRDERVVFIGSDVGPGTLAAFKQAFPSRFFMEGISEQHIIGMAAGLALEGFTPFINTIGTFLTRRCFEQIAIDVCLHDLPVRLVAFGGGVVYAPLGPTHFAVDDIALMRALPNMTVTAPCDADEMRRLIQASGTWKRPMYIRMGRGEDQIVSREEHGFRLGEPILFGDSARVLLVSTGVMTQRTLSAQAFLIDAGIPVCVMHVHTIKPLILDSVIEAVDSAEVVVTVEEHLRNGGLGSTFLEILADRNQKPFPRLIRLGLPDHFVEGYGTQEYLLDKYGLNVDSICSVVLNTFSPSRIAP